jgi:hypothetical protein
VKSHRISRKSTLESEKFVNLRTCRHYPPGDIPDSNLCQRLSLPLGHSAAGRYKSIAIPVTPSGIDPAPTRQGGDVINHEAVSNSYFT